MILIPFVSALAKTGFRLLSRFLRINGLTIMIDFAQGVGNVLLKDVVEALAVVNDVGFNLKVSHNKSYDTIICFQS